MPRPSFDETFFEVARAMALRSTCNRAQHGAVIVRDNQILATGYNGSPPGEPHCTEIGCLIEYSGLSGDDRDLAPHCIRTLHAEENAIIQAAKVGVSLEGATIYVTGEPCYNDAKRIARSGIKVIMVQGVHPYPDRVIEEWKEYIYEAAGISYRIVRGSGTIGGNTDVDEEHHGS